MSYQPPPEGSSSTPPEGGYSPPPPASGGGYSPPPPASSGGGYSAPPPPTGGGYSPLPMNAPSSPSPGGMNQAGMQGLVQNYTNVITKPSPGIYEAELPNANLNKVLIGIAAVAIVSAIVALIRGLMGGAAAANPFGNQLSGDQAALISSLSASVGVGGALFSLVYWPIAFFIGTGIQLLTAKLLGGQSRGDFMTQSYLSSLSYTPLRIIGAVAGIVPVVGFFIGLAAAIYQMYHVGLSLQVSQNLPAGKAMLAAFMPLIVGAVLGCLGVVACAGLLASLINSASVR